MLRILTDRGTEYCGRLEQRDCQLHLAMNDIEHTRTQAASPQTNGLCLCERFHKTLLQASRDCKPILTLGWSTPIMRAPTSGKCAVGERRWRPSPTARKSGRKNNRLNST